MAGRSSHRAVVKIQNAAGAMITVANINAAALDTAIAELDVSSAGNDDMEYVEGQRSTTFSGGGPWTAADHTLFTGILGVANRQIQVFLDGEDTGNPMTSATGFITAYNAGASLGSAATYTVTIRISGVVTYGVAP